MSLLQDIQSALLGEDNDIGPILLRLRLLAGKLGSNPLEEWVRHETEGYPVGADVPPYRILSVSYTGTFSNAAWKMSDAPIAPALVAAFAGDDWNTHELRDSAAEIDALIQASRNGSIGLNVSNLILKLEGKVYPSMTCHEVRGVLSPSGLKGVRSAIRSRMLSLTIELEKSVPGVAEIDIGKSNHVNAATVTNVTNQVIYGTYTSISNSGHGAHIGVNVATGDANAVLKALEEIGVPEADAHDFAEILKSEKPTNGGQPFGPKASEWIAGGVKQVLSGTWNVGLNVLTGVLTQAAIKYYGIS